MTVRLPPAFQGTEEELKLVLLREYFNGYTEINLRNPLTNEQKSLEMHISWIPSSAQEDRDSVPGEDLDQR
jgi:hypothetical protein